MAFSAPECAKMWAVMGWSHRRRYDADDLERRRRHRMGGVRVRRRHHRRATGRRRCDRRRVKPDAVWRRARVVDLERRVECQAVDLDGLVLQGRSNAAVYRSVSDHAYVANDQQRTLILNANVDANIVAGGAHRVNDLVVLAVQRVRPHRRRHVRAGVQIVEERRAGGHLRDRDRRSVTE